MTFARTLAGAGLVVAALAAGGCGGARPPVERAAVIPSTQSSGAADAAEARRREVDDLVFQAMMEEQGSDRAAFALAAADKATGDLGRTVAAVDAARTIVLDNIRNLETVGYKATTVRVADGHRVETYANFEQGSVENTGRPLDLAIQGDGFFKVAVNNDTGEPLGYTRNGNLFINNLGDLVLGMGDGYRLEPPIKVPTNVTEISVSQDGHVSVVLGGQTTKQAVGQIQLHRFINPHGLRQHLPAMFLETEASGPPTAARPGDAGTGQLLQGFLESSNVDLIRERLRLRFLSDWRAVLMRAVDGPPQPAPAAAAAAQ
jgi:flagellar basal body rod protein FlgG